MAFICLFIYWRHILYISLSFSAFRNNPFQVCKTPSSLYDGHTFLAAACTSSLALATRDSFLLSRHCDIGEVISRCTEGFLGEILALLDKLYGCIASGGVLSIHSFRPQPVLLYPSMPIMKYGAQSLLAPFLMINRRNFRTIMFPWRERSSTFLIS